MPPCMKAAPRFFLCLLCALVIAFLCASAPAGQVVVTQRDGYHVRLYDLDAGTYNQFVYTSNRNLTTLAANPLDRDIYFYTAGGYYHDLHRYNVDTGAIDWDLISWIANGAANIESMAVDPFHRELLIHYQEPPFVSNDDQWLDRWNIDTHASTRVFTQAVSRKILDHCNAGGYCYYRYEYYHDIEDIALDPFHRMVYWTDKTEGRIYRRSLQPGAPHEVLFSGLTNPYSIALDVGAGAIFWSEQGDGSNPASVTRGGINGTGPVIDLVTSFSGGPGKISVDPMESTVYWIDSGILRSCDYTGTGAADVLCNGSTISAAEVEVYLGPGAAPQSPRMPDDANDGFRFNDVDVSDPDVMQFFDPDPAIGYDYLVTGSKFASVLLPAVGESDYELYLWDGGWSFDANLTAGVEHEFAPGGVARFAIRGIDPNANLDPEDPTAFVTGLTFTDPGEVDVTMTAYVPEPTTCLLLLAGLGACAAGRKSKASRR